MNDSEWMLCKVKFCGGTFYLLRIRIQDTHLISEMLYKYCSQHITRQSLQRNTPKKICLLSSATANTLFSWFVLMSNSSFPYSVYWHQIKIFGPVKTLTEITIQVTRATEDKSSLIIETATKSFKIQGAYIINIRIFTNNLQIWRIFSQICYKFQINWNWTRVIRNDLEWLKVVQTRWVHRSVANIPKN